MELERTEEQDRSSRTPPPRQFRHAWMGVRPASAQAFAQRLIQGPVQVCGDEEEVHALRMPRRLLWRHRSLLSTTGLRQHPRDRAGSDELDEEALSVTCAALIMATLAGHSSARAVTHGCGRDTESRPRVFSSFVLGSQLSPLAYESLCPHSDSTTSSTSSSS
jgi:hypothetical protein